MHNESIICAVQTTLKADQTDLPKIDLPRDNQLRHYMPMHLPIHMPMYSLILTLIAEQREH